MIKKAFSSCSPSAKVHRAGEPVIAAWGSGLVERLFGEERRRLKIVPNVVARKLMASLITAVQREGRHVRVVGSGDIFVAHSAIFCALLTEPSA